MFLQNFRKILVNFRQIQIAFRKNRNSTSTKFCELSSETIQNRVPVVAPILPRFRLVF